MFLAGPLLHCQRLQPRLPAFNIPTKNKSSAFKNEHPRGNNEDVRINLKEKAADSVRRKSDRRDRCF